MASIHNLSWQTKLARLLVSLLVVTVIVGSLFSFATYAAQAQGAVCPANSLPVQPSDNVQTLANNNAVGTVFCLTPGIYRGQSVTPKNGQQFIGLDGAILNGSAQLTAFVREGNYWVAPNQTQAQRAAGECKAGYEGCNNSETLFFDNQPLQRVDQLAKVAQGKWFFNYDTDKVYFLDDPTGRKVELSNTYNAFYGNASAVTIRNLVIEKYAGPGQVPALNGDNSSAWIVESNTIQLNHGVGMRIGPKMQVRNNKILRNGQLGIGGVGDDVLVENNEIAYNNFANFSPGWEAGGTKFVKTNRLVVRNNYSHHNDGPGLWTDIDNINVLYENNLVEDNSGMGIFHEISYAAIIRNNTVRRNAVNETAWLYGAQIMVSSSRDVEVYGNQVTADRAHGITVIQQNRGTGQYGPWLAYNNYVHDNTILHLDTIGRDGIGADWDIDNFWKQSNNRFNNNVYLIPNNTTKHWLAQQVDMNFAGFRQRGYEPAGQCFYGPNKTPCDITQAAATLLPIPTTTATTTINPTTQAYKGQPLAIPGRVEAEDFDLGANGAAYFDNTAGQASGQQLYRTDINDVDIKPSISGGYALGWFADGEWLDYSVNVTTTGNYKLVISGGSVDANRKLRVELNGKNISGSITIPVLLSWDTPYIPLTIMPVALTAGTQKLRVVVETGFIDLDWVELQLFGTTPTPTQIQPTATPIQPTATQVPPTNTAVVPTATQVPPTATIVVPTTVVPTATILAATVAPSATLTPTNTAPANTAIPSGASIFAMLPAGEIVVGQTSAINIILNNPELMNGGAQALEAKCSLEQNGAVSGANIVAGGLFGPDPVILNTGFQTGGNLLFAVAQSGQTPLVNTSGNVFTINLVGNAPGSSGLNCTTKLIDGKNQELIVPFNPVQIRVRAQTVELTPAVTLAPPTVTPVPPTATLTATAIPPTVTPTATLVPPSVTPVPPTATLTATAIPPTVTPTATLVPPSMTPVPPTATLTTTAIPPTVTSTATLVPPSVTPVPPTTTLTATAIPPTVTPTATPTQPSTSAITGNVKRSSGQGQSISISLIDGSGNVVAQVFTQADGSFAFANVKAGAYTIKAEAPACLSGQGQVVVTDQQAVQLKALVLPLGDIVPSQPSSIDELDLVQLITSYNLVIGTQNGTSILLGDLDQNGTVGLSDLAVLAQNLRMTDPVAWK